MSRLQFLSYHYGFDYLNSEYVHQLFDVLARLKEDIRTFSKDKIINNLYKKAYENIDTYENDIIENIYNYSAGNKYDKALMFIGSSHRKSIIEKIKRYNKEQDLKLNWTFYDRGHMLPS